jgi:hypothetical protein
MLVFGGFHTMATFSITFEQTTAESRVDDAFSQHGWVDPKTERLMGLRTRADWRQSRIRRANAGAFEWPTLRAALAYMRDSATGPLHVEVQPEGGYVTVTCEQDGPDVVLRPRGYEHDDLETGYTLHIGGLRPYRALRLAQALARIL